MQLVNILIADDHQIFIDGIKSLLKDVPGFIVTATANNGEEVLTIYAANPAIDIILMDIQMPRLNGIDTTKKLLANYPHLKILLLTMVDEPLYIKKAIQAGAVGYILKNTDKDELITALKKVTSGEQFYSTMAVQRLSEAPLNTLANNLTKREMEVLKKIAQGFTDKDIAKALFISPETVHSHRKNLYIKLNTNNVGSLLKTAYDLGLL